MATRCWSPATVVSVNMGGMWWLVPPVPACPCCPSSASAVSPGAKPKRPIVLPYSSVPSSSSSSPETVPITRGWVRRPGKTTSQLHTPRSCSQRCSHSRISTQRECRSLSQGPHMVWARCCFDGWMVQTGKLCPAVVSGHGRTTPGVRCPHW